MKENPGVQRISPEHQKDVLTNLIPSDVFSKLNKKKSHGFYVYSINSKTFYQICLIKFSCDHQLLLSSEDSVPLMRLVFIASRVVTSLLRISSKNIFSVLL